MCIQKWKLIIHAEQMQNSENWFRAQFQKPKKYALKSSAKLNALFRVPDYKWILIKNPANYEHFLFFQVCPMSSFMSV